MAQIMNNNMFISKKNTLDDRKMLWIFKYTCRHFRKCIVYVYTYRYINKCDHRGKNKNLKSEQTHIYNAYKASHDRYRMIVGFTPTYAFSVYLS